MMKMGEGMFHTRSSANIKDFLLSESEIRIINRRLLVGEGKALCIYLNLVGVQWSFEQPTADQECENVVATRRRKVWSAIQTDVDERAEEGGEELT